MVHNLTEGAFASRFFLPAVLHRYARLSDRRDCRVVLKTVGICETFEILRSITDE